MDTELSSGSVRKPRSPKLRVGRAALLTLVLASIGPAAAQSILNGTFSSGNTGWSSCSTEIGVSILYGGGSLTDRVAAVNGGGFSGTADDNMLCQTISSLIPGTIYQISFQATRCTLPFTPTSVSVSVSVDNVAEDVVTCVGGWNMTTSTISFVATSTSHTLTITPNFNNALGMLIDNVSLSVLSPLPITLLYFDAHPDDEIVRLEWATASEENNAWFTVERSEDVRTWSEVAGLPGAGFSHEMRSYATVDGDPASGISYYRLRQIDADGSSVVSPVSVVYRASDGTWHLYPNPVHDHLSLEVGEEIGGPLSILDPMGRCVRAVLVDGSHKASVDVEGWAPGVYHVHSEKDGRSAPFIVR